MLRVDNWSIGSAIKFRNGFEVLLGAYDQVGDKWSVDVNRPAYFCAGMSLEHFLKSVIPSPPHSHDLCLLLHELSEEAKVTLLITEYERTVIELLNKHYFNSEEYGRFSLRYRSVAGPAIFPHVNDVLKLLYEVESRIKPYVR
jgi:hypothetical protein